jgi:methionine-rich copper-binding protein CopC
MRATGVRPAGPAAVRAAVRSVVLAAFALVILAGVAFAHALPQSSDPSPGASLAQAPTQVSIVFGERPDLKLSSINVLDTTGAPVTSGPTAVAPRNEEELVVPLKPLPAGVYTVAWRSMATSPPGRSPSVSAGQPHRRHRRQEPGRVPRHPRPARRPLPSRRGG